MKRFATALIAVGIFGLLGLGASGGAQALGNPTLDLYFSPPFVQGSEVSGASESFDAFSTGPTACATSWGAVGTATGDCKVSGWDSAGGAAVGPTDSTPTVNATGTNYAATEWTGGSSLKTIDVTFTAPIKYVGLWWSAGNGSNGSSFTNIVDFYSGDTMVAEMTADDVTNILGTLPNPYPGDNVTGGAYPRGYYFGDPLGYASTTPSNALTPGTWSYDAPFVYLNLFVDGDYSIDRMVISGDGFEFDNVVTSVDPQVPSDNLVLAKTIDVTPPTPPTPDPTPAPVPDNGGGSGLPETGIVWLTFGGIAVAGVFMFLLAAGAFRSRSTLHLIGVDDEVKAKLESMRKSFARMDRLNRRRRY